VTINNFFSKILVSNKGDRFENELKFVKFILAIILHLTIVHVTLELFNIIPFLDYFTLTLGLIVSMVPLLIAIWRLKSFKDVTFWTSLALPIVVFFVWSSFSPFEYDGLNYHLPKLLLQLTNGDLSLHYGQPFLINSAISFHDNYNMLYFSFFKNLNALVVGNIIFGFFILYSCSLLFRLIDSGNTTFFVFILFVLCCPSFIGELFIFKPNVIVPSFWIMCITGLVYVLVKNQIESTLVFLLIATSFSFLFITKVTVFLALCPLIIFSVYTFVKSSYLDLQQLVLALFFAGLVTLVVLGPYILRQYYFHGSSLYAKNLWSFLPPKLDCGLYFWPQHFSTIIDYIAQLFGGQIKGNITPKECSGNPVKFINTRYFVYPRDFGLTLFMLVGITFRSIRKSDMANYLFLIALVSPVIHAMFYANSVNNYRLVSFIYVVFAAGYAISVSNQIKQHQILIIGLLSGFSLVSAATINPKQLSGYNASNYDFVIVGGFNTDNSKANIEVTYAQYLTGIGLIRLLEQVNYDWDKFHFSYKNDPNVGGQKITHQMLCENQQIAIIEDSFKDIVKIEKEISGCYLVNTDVYK